jgi:hypothetical protein
MSGKPIRILQINLNRSAPATESTFETALELNIDIIAVQEPWVFPAANNDYTNTRSIIHQGFTQVLPNHGLLRPRTLCYISKNLAPGISTSLASTSPRDPDCLIIDIQNRGTKIQLINIYNEKDLSGSRVYTLKRGVIPAPLSQNSIILGDFNIHHPWWDPLARKSPLADDLVEWITVNNLLLLNTPGAGTFFRPNMSRPTVIDLTLCTSPLLDRVQDWQILPDLGSDHYGIRFNIVEPTSSTISSENPHLGRYNTKKANWEHFTRKLQQNIRNSSLPLLTPQQTYLPSQMDDYAQAFTEAITNAANTSIPRTTYSVRSKPWWTPEIKALRKRMSYLGRKLPGSPELKQEYTAAKNTYFNTIKTAKTAHWNAFLEKEDPKSIFKAMAYTKDLLIQPIPSIWNASTNAYEDSFSGKCAAFRDTLFPDPPRAPDIDLCEYHQNEYWKWPKLSKTEVQNACTTKIKGKTPGPDLITQEIITHAYQAIPEVFYSIYSMLINTGYHPKCWRQAIGVILKKPKKPDYSVPKAYRVIALLNCLGKVSERILAQRLSYLAETTHLLHPTQIGGRLKKSAIDAALLLTHEVEQNHQLGLKTSTLFLDVKGAFDHVAKNQLLAILKQLRLPKSLITWVSSFLESR